MKTLLNLNSKAILLIFLLNSCVSTISFETKDDDGDDNLVVYGEITDSPGPYSIEIYKSTPFFEANTSIGNAIVRDAHVVLHDIENNYSEDLVLRNGKYWTSENGIRGEVGNGYFLSIQVEDKVYQSSVQYILPVAKIDSVSYEVVYLPQVVNNITKDFPYAQLYAYFQDDPNTTNYYMWKWSGITQIKTFPELHFFRENNVEVLDPLPCSGAFGEACTCCDCWVQHGTENPLTVFSDVYQNGSYINEHPLFLIPITSNLFDVELRLSVRQQSINSDIYSFWNQIAGQQQSQGTIFALPPGTVNGNIRNINDDGEVVWGAFIASAVSTHSQFISRSDFDFRFPKDTIKESCLTVNSSTNIRPDYWQD